MRKTKRSRKGPMSLETLEGRAMMSGTPWAFFAHLIGQDAVAQNYPGLTGKGETVVVIDQGVDYNHPVLGGGFGAGHKVIAGWDFAGRDGNPFCDTNAHGTAVAGIIAGNNYTCKGTQNQGIVPGANIIALRQNSQAGIKAAFDWVIANRTKYNIVAVDFTDPGSAPHADYNPEIKTLYNAGVFVATPAGNGGPSQFVWGDPNDFTVGGVGHNDKLTSFSARGAAVDMVAPADGVTIPYYDIRTGMHVVTDIGQGTSWAAPYVTGAAAMIKQINPKFTPGQIMSILKDSGHGVYDTTSKRTYSRLDLLAAVKLAYARSGATSSKPTTTATTTTKTTTAKTTTAKATTTRSTTSKATTPAASQSPFTGRPVAVAATGTVIQVENFDNGPDGVAYHDLSAENKGGQYRNTGVDIERTGDTGGGYDVGWVGAGDWMEYTVSIPSTGSYNLDVRLASSGPGGTFHLEQDGVAKTRTTQVPDTGGWQSWRTVTIKNVQLSAGTHVLKLVMDNPGPTSAVANFNWFRIISSASAPKATPKAPTTSGWYLVGSYTAANTSASFSTSYDFVISRQHAGALSGQVQTEDGRVYTLTGQLSRDGTFTLAYTDFAGRHIYLPGHVGKGGARLAGGYSARIHHKTVATGMFLAHKAA